MFTTACFIRKDTPMLRKKLEEMGYKGDVDSKGSGCIATYTVNNGGYTVISEEAFDDSNPHRTWGNGLRVDCGKNEELFLAIAALNDATDKWQWFTDGKKWLNVLSVSWNMKRASGSCESKIHKATVEEMVAHFNEAKTKKEDKTLLAKDLCARLPYKVKVFAENMGMLPSVNRLMSVDFPIIGDDEVLVGLEFWDSNLYGLKKIGEVKPYLFPLSSMTKKQKKEAESLKGKTEYVDFLNENHFDYHGLIARGLAIDRNGKNIY